MKYKYRFEIFIENFDEEFETIDIVDTLEEARFIAYQIPVERYKSIMIHKLDENGRFIEEYDID